jgi:hypothetical protein
MTAKTDNEYQAYLNVARFGVLDDPLDSAGTPGFLDLVEQLPVPTFDTEANPSEPLVSEFGKIVLGSLR